MNLFILDQIISNVSDFHLAKFQITFHGKNARHRVTLIKFRIQSRYAPNVIMHIRYKYGRTGSETDRNQFLCRDYSLESSRLEDSRIEQNRSLLEAHTKGCLFRHLYTHAQAFLLISGNCKPHLHITKSSPNVTLLLPPRRFVHKFGLGDPWVRQILFGRCYYSNAATKG